MLWGCRAKFIGYVSIVDLLTNICRSFLRVSKVTEKIKTRSKPTPSENFNNHPLQGHQRVKVSTILHESHCITLTKIDLYDDDLK
jgi:hypothetical protein